MAVETQFTANTGLVTISTANSNLDGTGALGTVITGSSNGTLIKTIIIKAQTSTVQGMVRFFVKSHGTYFLLTEVPIPIITKSARDIAFQMVIPVNYTLQSGDTLYAATEQADTFNIIAEGLNWTYGASTPSNAQYTSNTGVARISTANSNLDGTGTLGTVLTAASSAADQGCEISSIIVKAFQSTTPGMVRLYLDNGGGAVLFSEVVIPAVTQNALNTAFSCEVISQGALAIKPGCLIKVSTENAEKFNVFAEGADWHY